MGLNIHKCKTKFLKVNSASMEPVKLERNEIEEVDTFTYLGSIIDKHGCTVVHVKVRIGKGRGIFIQLKNIWSCMEQRHGGQLTPPPRKYRPL